MADLIKDLRQNILALKPDGEEGFEGLLAAVLTEVTKCSFALASAGTQNGRDGQSAMDGGAVVFEAKLYDRRLGKDKILSKILELGTSIKSVTDLYIIGATCDISTQYLDTFAAGAEKFGIALLTLSWPDTGLAPLATLLAMAPDVSAQFIAEHASINEQELLSQLSAVVADSQFEGRSAEIRSALKQPSIAPALALRDNKTWLKDVFTNRIRARTILGQALSPGDASNSVTMERAELRGAVAKALFADPDGSTVALIGAEGNGKSWIFAQAWSTQADPPLTVVIVPDDIISPPSAEYCRDLLILKLLTQTGDVGKSGSKDRWLRHFDRWQSGENAPLRLLVFMDGINQRVTINWSRYVEAMTETLDKIGGRLVVSCRQLYYRDHLQPALASTCKVVELSVPEWTDEELGKLLEERGTTLSALEPNIVRSLRNPRFFGVAATLFKSDQITAFGELSVSRLLFEHIRISTADAGSVVSASQFSSDICRHADDIVKRLRQGQIEGVDEFDLVGPSRPMISDQFDVTKAGRFFEILDEDRNKYVLKDDGLTLALGLALVKSARGALRKGKSVDAELGELLDPISALDRTSGILLDAILAAVLENSPKEIVAPLVRSFVMLQNLDSSRYSEFRHLFLRNPDGFFDALERSVLTNEYVSNLSWLTNAIYDLRNIESFESILTKIIHRWLSMYSLSPRRMVAIRTISSVTPEEEEKLGERREELARMVAALSHTERMILEQMIREDQGNYSELSRIAFQALVGKPLAPFANSFRNWCLASSLNGGYHDPTREFNDLMQFNVTDWSAMRNTLQAAIAPLRETGISEVGQWALNYALYATGDTVDAVEAEGIAAELIKDQEPLEGWRLIESYCATDPCDPGSTEPDNIEMTAAKYRMINPGNLRGGMGGGEDDRLFVDAMPGLARFRPDAAIGVLRALACQALTRQGEAFRMAVFFLENHTIGLEKTIASPYIQKAHHIAKEVLIAGVDKHNVGWISAQYALAVAFPHMEGDAQFDALVNHPADQTFLRILACFFQPIKGEKFERALAKAVADDNPVSQFRILGFAEYSGTPLTTEVKKTVVTLLSSTHKHVRLSALSLIQALEDQDLLVGVVESGWAASGLDPVDNKVELLCGSIALVLAATRGLISLEACLDRIALCGYEALVKKLGGEAVNAIVERLNIAIRRTAEFPVLNNLPDIEQCLEGRHWPAHISVSDNPSKEENLKQKSRRPMSAGDTWHERQDRNQKISDDFERDLNKAGAKLIIESVTAELISAIDELVPGCLDNWCDLILKMNENALNNLYNFAAIVAQVLSGRDQKASLALFDRLRGGSPHVRTTYGSNKISIDAATAWGSTDNPEMRAFLHCRLDRINNDQDLAMEVLAAVRAKRLEDLREYVVDRRQRVEPAHRARATMLAGLSPDEPWALETIDMLKDKHGFLASVYEGAKYAMERHQWSRHWVSRIRMAKDSNDVWRFAVLLSKIADGRISLAELEGDSPSPLIRRFGSTLESPILDRIRKWEGKRRTQLFGGKTSSLVGLHDSYSECLPNQAIQ